MPTLNKKYVTGQIRIQFSNISILCIFFLRKCFEFGLISIQVIPFYNEMYKCNYETLLIGNFTVPGTFYAKMGLFIINCNFLFSIKQLLNHIINIYHIIVCRTKN